MEIVVAGEAVEVVAVVVQILPHNQHQPPQPQTNLQTQLQPTRDQDTRQRKVKVKNFAKSILGGVKMAATVLPRGNAH